MTYLEKYRGLHPGYTEEEIISDMCPTVRLDGYIPTPSWCNHTSCGDACKRCWNREISETDNVENNKEDIVMSTTKKTKAELVEEIDAESDRQDEQIERLEREITELRNKLAERAQLIDDLKNKLDDKTKLAIIYAKRMDTKDAMIKKLEKLNEDLKKNSTTEPVDDLPYAKMANHIRLKYQALIDQGFSHDDAMMLIPMWTDY